MQRQLVTLTMSVGLLLSSAGESADLRAEVLLNREPISYAQREAQDAVAQLQKRVADGSVSLVWDDDHGWLPSLLEALGIPHSSQSLVFSKTSLQQRHISPTRPRAIYFNDNVYVGWVQRGDKIELSAVDPSLGAVFYTVHQSQAARPEILRDRSLCLICHASPKTKGVPGYFIRSVFPQTNGHPELSLGSRTVDHGTPFVERWGGWFVTGTHGGMRHHGNMVVTSADPLDVDLEKGANCTQLEDLIRTRPYLQPTSDIVALMVLEHQTQMHNLITRASYVARQAIHEEQAASDADQLPVEQMSNITRRRIEDAADDLLQYMLFSGESPLSDEVRGNSSYAADFVALGPRDSQGRSLRDFDLSRRLFRYPCSFLIYSESFLALPAPVLDRIEHRLVAVLAGRDESKSFAHLTTSDRDNIRAILSATHPRFGPALSAGRQ